MRNALSLANFFIDLAQQKGTSIRPLRLMKLVYISHGFILALLNKSFLDPRYDHVEAWKFGPVIPSVYHSFKSFRDKPITEKAVVFKGEVNALRFIEPTLDDEEAKQVCNFVWNAYEDKTDSEIVTLLHGKGTPWGKLYIENKNVVIPDEITKAYYSILVNRSLNAANGRP